MSKKEKLIVSLVILFIRTAFLFTDAFFSAKQKSKIIDQTQIAQNITNTTIKKTILPEISEIHEVAWEIQDTDDTELTKFTKTISENIEKGLDWAKLKIDDIKNEVRDLDILEKIYQKDNNPDILKILLDKLVEDFQFDKAKEYIWNINIFEDKTVDIKTYIYTYINWLSILDDDGMTKFMSFIDQIRYKSLIDSDDYVFYQWLAKIWAKDYKWANILFSQIESSKYSDFISQINNSIQKFDNQKWVPSYYKDSLIWLVMMKNWYFSVANKLALSSILQDEDYILPHQIMAYSNFLTNNREKSIENFYDLVKLDYENQDKYNFYIWVSNYRWWNYQESIWILSQLLNNSEYKTDAYRYLLLNYIQLNDEEKKVQVRQKLLGQNDLQQSDFKNFYDIVFYEPFSTNSKYTIYNKYRQLSYDFVSMCYENLWQNNDTCLYGEVWLDLVNESREDVENGLLYLSENYPQADIFQALWDYYKSKHLDEKSKTYYIKAASLTDNISQKDIIEQKLISEIN